MATASIVLPITSGGAFLIEDRPPDQIFTAEDLSQEHLAIARTVDEFWAREVAPNLEAIQHHQPGVARDILRKAAGLGLTAIMIPEKFGGMELDLTAMMVAGEHFAGDASWSGWQSAHVGIGTLPLLFFGNEQQKRKYLPKLANVEMLAAYALTEPHAGSDALAARTRADLTPDGTHYILNGQKMWITNGGAADLFTVFAKVGGEKFTAFLVERGFGVKSGAEEQKMGIKGSSTTALYFDNVPVPVENVLGEIGRGHIIAFNILNIGRLKLGPGTLGGAKKVLAVCLKYAKDRKAFGSPIAEFGAIQQKLAEMAIRIYATESIVWRTVGLVESRLRGFSWDHPNASETMLKAVEEFATECSIVKVYCSEMLDYVVDEGVQIHGGYGFHQDYAVERAYRDSRINRIFEGTNEINRLLIPGMLLKRDARGQLALLSAGDFVLKEATDDDGDAAGDAADLDAADEARRLVGNAKRIVLLSLAAAHRKYPDTLDKQQEILMHIADMAIETYAMESALLRSRKLAGRDRPGGPSHASDLAAVLLRDGMARIEIAARNVLAAAPGPGWLQLLRRLASYEPVDAIELRRRIARRMLQAERYLV
ncbi:MAG TPA: acyl-CoA dehydrogenase family protein [Candidatus Acidoferrales bacterium]|nr:acyl-CoA dehydrogenase family protein [Candidatus Acidoferrales bacterium]